jgi:outer membrane protein OmpA-like peptidoglycan-associated protein
MTDSDNDGTPPSTVGTEPPAIPGDPALRVTAIVSLLVALFGAGALAVYVLDVDRALRPTDRPLAGTPASTDRSEKPGDGDDRAGSGVVAADAAMAPAGGQSTENLHAEVQRLNTELDAARARIAELERAIQAADSDSTKAPQAAEGISAALAEAQAKAATLEQQLADTRESLIAAEEKVALAEERAEMIENRNAELYDAYRALRIQFTYQGQLVRLDETALRFEPGATQLPEPHPAALHRVADFLDRHPELSALLRGHTDSTGSAATNATLSARRAAAVRDALIDLGVAPDRLQSEGVGAAEPIADNASPLGRSRNRRVEILLIENRAG